MIGIQYSICEGNVRQMEKAFIWLETEKHPHSQLRSSRRATEVLRHRKLMAEAHSLYLHRLQQEQTLRMSTFTNLYNALQLNVKC